ncbi:hypothetical protein NMY22_g17520 [Coprinellus aureogranulatus]|nr:hypothetical protein NMY22_g17520 [Coprinellus aureogranulatus]
MLEVEEMLTRELTRSESSLSLSSGSFVDSSAATPDDLYLHNQRFLAWRNQGSQSEWSSMASLDDVSIHAPPSPINQHSMDASLHGFESLGGGAYRKVIRSDADLMTPEAIAKRSEENQRRLQVIAYQETREALQSVSLDDEDPYGSDTDSDDVLPNIDLPRDMDLSELIREDTPVPEQRKSPAKLGPEGTHIITSDWQILPVGNAGKPQEYPEEWVLADSRRRLVPQPTLPCDDYDEELEN